MKKVFRFLGLSLWLSFPLLGQATMWDSLNVQYRLIQSNYGIYEDIIKIKLPPHLNTSEVIRQVRMVVQFPGSPPPQKKTTVYIFKDDARVGDRSKNGGVYQPGKGFKWDLEDWHPDGRIFSYEPRDFDFLVYNALLDSMFTNGFYALEFEDEESASKQNVARRFDLKVAELDSIYYRVKWWKDLRKAQR